MKKVKEKDRNHTESNKNQDIEAIHSLIIIKRGKTIEPIKQPIERQLKEDQNHIHSINKAGINRPK